MFDDSLRSLLARYGLENHAAGFEANGLDLAALGAADDDMVKEFAAALSLNLGDRAKLVRLCRDMRDGRHAPAGGVADSQVGTDAPRALAAEMAPIAHAIPPLESPLEPELIAHLPTPIARAAHAVLDARDAFHLADALETVVDTMLRFLALVCKADYLSAPAWFDQRLNDLFTKLDRPQLGVWREFLDLSIAGAASAGHPLFLSELRDTWIRTEHEKPEVHEGSIWNDTGLEERRRNRLGRLEWLVNLRNAFAHNKVPRRDVQFCIAGRDVAVRSVRDYRWLRDYELWASDGKAMILLQGLTGQAAPGGPGELRRSRGVSLRRRSAQSPTGRRTLELPPLIVSEAMITSASHGGATATATALLYGGISGPNDVQYSAPDTEGGVRPVRTTRHLTDLRRRQAAKRFPRIGRSGLDYDTLLARTTAATERTLRILEETQKFRRELHVERLEYEPRLAPWIDSPVPLLGIAAEAGAGKTGILASLVHRWRESSDKPVMFMLARDFQSMATIDRVIRETLMLADDVTAVDVAAVLTGLVVVVDGLNEHPNRIDLLDGIRSLARGALERHTGPRFAISWRTEDATWMTNALSERALWWTPSSAAVLNSIRDLLVSTHGKTDAAQATEDGGFSTSIAGQFGDRSPNNDAAVNQGDGKPGRDESHSGHASKTRVASRPRDSADSPEARPFITVMAFEEHEVAAAWERYRTLDPQRMAPRFDWQRLRDECPELAWDLRNPLRMRIAMECYHDRELPEHLRVEEVFGTYLDSLRGRMKGVADLLAILGEMMLETRQNRFEVADLERRGRFDLVYAGSPMSAFDFLVSAGVLSVLDEQGRKAFTFTVERVAEQVLGENVAALEDAETAESLARLADDIPGERLILGPGAIRVALCSQVATHGRDFLYDFIDANPIDVGNLAGGALASLVVSAGEAGAASIAEELLVEPTDADFTVAAKAADYFSRRGAHSIARAFLEPFVADDRLEHVASTSEAGNVAVKYLECRRQESPFESLTWTDAIVESLRRLASQAEPAASYPLCKALETLGLENAAQGDHPRAIQHFREAVDLHARALAVRPFADRRRSLAVTYERLGDSLQATGQFDEALGAYGEALDAGMTPERCLNWRPASVWYEIANVHTARGDLDAAIEALKTCMQVSLVDKALEGAAFSASHIGDRYATRGEGETGVAWQRTAVKIARESGDRRLIACALEWLGDALRKAEHFKEALESYQEAIHVGTVPERCPDWSLASVWREIVRVYSTQEDWDAAIEAETQFMEVLLDDGELDEAARSASRVGDLFAKKGDQTTGAERKRRAVVIARESGDRRLIACALEWLGDALREAEKFEDALESYREAINVGMTPERCDGWSLASPWYEIARVHSACNAWDAAIEAETHCMEALLEDGVLDEATRSAARLGNLNDQKGDRASALEWHRRAVEIARQEGSPRCMSAALEWLGDALREMKKFPEAIAAYREGCGVLTLLHGTPDQDRETNGLVWYGQLIADAYLKMGNADKAHDVLKECEPHVPVLAADHREGLVDTAAAWWERLAEVCAARGDDAGRTRAQLEASQLRERLAAGSTTTS